MITLNDTTLFPQTPLRLPEGAWARCEPNLTLCMANSALHTSPLLSLPRHQLHLVMLQEVWIDSDASLLSLAASKAGLSHSVHFKSGTFGSGLLTLSRHPIVASGFHRYSGAGDALAILCGDYLAAKGYGWVRVRISDSPNLLLDVFNTHTHANYSHMTKQLAFPSTKDDEGHTGEFIFIPKDHFSAYRMSQIWELAQGIIQKHQCRLPDGLSNSNGVLLGGDLNSKPDSLEMSLLLSHLGSSEIHLADAWTSTHILSSSSSPCDGPIGLKASAIKEKKGKLSSSTHKKKEEEEKDDNDLGFTCQGPGCSFKSTRQIPERIDYLLSTMKPLSSMVTLKTVPDLPYHLSYSDHFAVHASFSLPVSSSSPSSAATTEPKKVASKAPEKTKVKGLSSEPKDGVPEGNRELKSKEVLRASWQVVKEGAERCRGLRSSALRGAFIALLVAFLCITVALWPSDSSPTWLDFDHTGNDKRGGGTLSSLLHSQTSTLPPFSSSRSPSSHFMVTWIERLGLFALALIALLFSSLSLILVLKGLLVDTSQERALDFIAHEMKREIQ
jgi:sphingomyelin phosphodiesterase 2